jgi:hypothetical protein
MKRLINLRGGASFLICAAATGLSAQNPAPATAQGPSAPAQAQQASPQTAPQARGIIPKFTTRQIQDGPLQGELRGNNLTRR